MFEKLLQDLKENQLFLRSGYLKSSMLLTVALKKYIARFVARGFSQKEGIDYEETIAPIARYTSVRKVLAIVASKG